MPEIGGFKECPVYNRMKIGFQHKRMGPAIIEQMDSTIVLNPKDKGIVDDYGNIVIDIG